MPKQSKVQKKVQKEGLKRLKKLGLNDLSSEVDKLVKSYTRKGGGLRFRNRKGGKIRQEFKSAQDGDSIMDATVSLSEISSREFDEIRDNLRAISARFEKMDSLDPAVVTFMASELKAAQEKVDGKAAEVLSVIGYKQMGQQAKVAKESGDLGAAKELRAQAKVAKLGVKEFKKGEKLLQKQAKSDVQDRGRLIKEKCEKLKSFITKDVASEYQEINRKDSEGLKKALKLPKQKQHLVFSLVGREAKKNKTRYGAKAFKGFLDAIKGAQDSLHEIGLTTVVSELEIKSFIDSAKVKGLGFDLSQDNISGLLSGDIFQGGDSLGKSIDIATILDNIAAKYGAESADALFEKVKLDSEVMQKYSSQDFTTKYTLITKFAAMREELIGIREQDRALGFQNPDDKYIVGGEEFSIDDVVTDIDELDLKSPAYIQRQYNFISSAIEQQKQLQPGLIQKSLLDTREKIIQFRDLKSKGGSKFKPFSIDCSEGKVWFNEDSAMLVAKGGVTLKFDSQYAQLQDKVDDADLITKRDRTTSIKMDDISSIKGVFDKAKLLRFDAAIVEAIDNEEVKAKSSRWSKFRGWLRRVRSSIASALKITSDKRGYQQLATQDPDLAISREGSDAREGDVAILDEDHQDSQSLDTASRSSSPAGVDQDFTQGRLQSMPHVKHAIEEGHALHRRGSFVAQAEAHGHHAHHHGDDHSHLHDMQERQKAAAAADHDHA